MSPCYLIELKLVVTFGKRMKSGIRKDAFSENTRNTQKYNDLEKASFWQLDTSDFLVFSYTEKDNFNEVYISYPHMKQMMDSMKNVHKWFFDNKVYDSLFVENSEGIFETDLCRNTSEKFTAINGHSVAMQPALVTDKEDDVVPGLYIFINSESCCAKMTWSEFDAMFYFLTKFDLCTTSMILTNSAISTILFKTLNPNSNQKEEKITLNKKSFKKGNRGD
jgi:hypothetical protein